MVDDPADPARIVWRPDTVRASSSNMARFIDALRTDGTLLAGANDADAFRALHAWSVTYPAEFWSRLWQDCGIIAEPRPGGLPWREVVVGGDRMAPPDDVLGPQWFTGAHLNYAENLLRRDGDDAAIIAWDERGPASRRTWRELRREVASIAAGLSALGLRPGDRVAGWLPNIPETIVAMLATASLGAVWTSCSPDFGVDGIVDRFGQVEPVVLLFCDGYRYGGRHHDCAGRADALLARLPTVRHAVMISYLGSGALPADPRARRWSALLAATATGLHFRRLPFHHPLYILYSSGTTGLPKCMVHSAGGVLLQHMKEHRLHVDLRPGERLFYFTTCGWMMWNWQVSALAAGATLVIYDGAPMPEVEPGLLWRLAATERVAVFGTSAKYLALAEKSQLHPARDHDPGELRAVLSTGSPLAAAAFDWIGQEVGDEVQVASISGGTDLVSCFVLGNPLSPVHRGEIQGPGLAMAVDVAGPDGRSCAVGEPGELVCRQPFPSMPIAFWNDPDGAKYRAAYFDTWPGVWRHGDWIERTPSGGFIISGRSDATLNPGGVRIGTAELYRQVEAIAEVVESVVVAQRGVGAGDADERIILFVRLRGGLRLTDELRDAIRRRIRQGTSPHHVPRVIVQVADIPRTRSGKVSELAVRDVIEGRPVPNVGALANPEALEEFRAWRETGG